MREMRNGYLLSEQQSGFYRATVRLIVRYEQTDRVAVRYNEIRRWVLQQVGEIDENAVSEGLCSSTRTRATRIRQASSFSPHACSRQRISSICATTAS